MFKVSLLFSILSLFHVSNAETVTWALNAEGTPYESLTMYSRETITFEYPGDNINVYLHPSGTCNDTDSELVGLGGAGNATYTFNDSQIDTEVTFACQYWNYCEMFGMIIKVTVLEPPPSSSPTSPPTKTAAPTGPEPTAAPVAATTPPPTPASGTPDAPATNDKNIPSGAASMGAAAALLVSALMSIV